MNSAWMFHVAEWGALALAWLAALGLAAWPRRRMEERGKRSDRPMVRWVWAALAGTLSPALALGLGWMALKAPHWLGSTWAERMPESHRDAWGLFWTTILALNLLEATALQIAAALGRGQMPALLRGVLSFQL